MLSSIPWFLLELLLSSGTMIILAILLIRRFFTLARVLFWLGLGILILQILVYRDIAGPRTQDQEYHIWKNEILTTPQRITSKVQGETILTLSWLSRGLYYYGVSRHQLGESAILLNPLIHLAIAPAHNPYRVDLKTVTLGGEGLYLSHLLTILEYYSRCTNDTGFRKIQDRIYNHLLDLVRGSPHFHIASYSTIPWRWPADNAVVYYSLWLYEDRVGTTHSQPYRESWLHLLETKYRDPETRLPVSEITRGPKYAAVPRGCANDWLVIFSRGFAPQLTSQWWEEYKKLYKRKAALFSAFREYPLNRSFPADADSGPILGGYGASASAFGIIAARSMGDGLTWLQLSYSHWLVEQLISLFRIKSGADVEILMNSTLARAIRFNF